MNAPLRTAGLGLVALVLLLVALSAGSRARQPFEYRETLYVFGTLVEIVIRNAEPEAAARASADAGQLLQTLHHEWHAWREGELTALNTALSQGRAFTVSSRLGAVLEQGRALSCESGGLFDPAVGHLVALWGFHADTPPDGPVPTRASIAAVQAHNPSMSDLDLAGRAVRSRSTAVRLDLGGFGKGAALDLAEARLTAHGITDAVLNAGGDVNVMGQHSARPWRVAIRDPFVWGAVASVEMRAGEVLYTSGNYERFIDLDGERFAHILDPRTGYPVQSIVSVSVLHTDGARADAAATALSVAGVSEWTQVAADMGIEAALLITNDGQMLATHAMADRLTLEQDTHDAALNRVDLPPRRVSQLCDSEARPRTAASDS